MKPRNRMYLRAAFEQARRAGVTTADIEKAANGRKEMKVTEWRKLLEDLAASMTLDKG